jgi:hypothetical protein
MMMLLASIVPALMWDWNVDEATGTLFPNEQLIKIIALLPCLWT